MRNIVLGIRRESEIGTGILTSSNSTTNQKFFRGIKQ